jgi:hypothetical protein
LAGTAALAGAAGLEARAAERNGAAPPWQLRTRRWSQINLTDEDPAKFDLAFWRAYWKETRTQGVLLNAGGVSAFYPSKVPEHHRAKMLGDRDFFGDLASACRADGLTVVARMAFRGPSELLNAHPDWCVADAEGHRLPIACMNGSYTYDHSSKIVREVASHYRPDGITASGWGPYYGLCYCDVCTRLFKEKSGADLPRKRNWDDPIYRTWIEWNSDRVMVLWDHYDQVAKEAAGPECHWAGQVAGTLITRSLKDICDRAAIVMIDHQQPDAEGGFQDNSTTGKLYNGLRGWNRPVVEATAIYWPRMTSKTPVEWQSWMQEGIAGGLQPWWHTVASYSEDKRRFSGVASLMQWHEKNERYLFNRTPVATIGVVWSDTNNIFYGRDKVSERIRSAWLGVTQALSRARIPFIVVHADNIDQDAATLRALVLPDLAAMTDAQIAGVKRFVLRGGGLFATGKTGLYDRYGDPRQGYAFGDLYGADVVEPPQKEPQEEDHSADQIKATVKRLEAGGVYFSVDDMRAAFLPGTHLRLTPELARNVKGPHFDGEPPVPPGAVRHPILSGLENTDIIYFGGTLAPLRLAKGAEALLTFVPPVPFADPEFVYFSVPRTNVPGLVVNTLSNGSRVVFMPADLDRRYTQLRLPDHADLVANAARWVAQNDVPLVVEGLGVLDCNLYQQPGRMILHLSNLSNARPARLEEMLPAGPLKVRIKLDAGASNNSGKLLVLDRTAPVIATKGWAEVQIPAVHTHEVLVIESRS